MSPEDRKKFGVETREEMTKKIEAKSEKQLQDQIVAYAGYRGIKVIRSRMDKKSTNNVGTPDLLFCVMVQGFPRGIAIETKFGTGTCTREQNDMQAQMKTRPNAWDVRVINNFVQVVDLFREMDL